MLLLSLSLFNILTFYSEIHDFFGINLEFEIFYLKILSRSLSFLMPLKFHTSTPTLVLLQLASPRREAALLSCPW